MKKLIYLYIILSLSLIKLYAQNHYNLDIKKLDKALQEVNLGDDFTYEPVSYYLGYLTVYKSDFLEVIVSIKSIEETENLRNDKKIQTFKSGDKEYHYFENQYISELYYDMPKYNISFYITTYLRSKEYLLELMQKIRPDYIIEQSYIQ